jgi:formate-dependent nitrite reductase cytochrome c552 subunit
MADEKKFTEDELQKVEDIQKKYASIQLSLGQLGFSKIRLENEIKLVNENESKLKLEFNNVQKEEQDFMTKVTEKYGEGVLDPKTGLFSAK